MDNSLLGIKKGDKPALIGLALFIGAFLISHFVVFMSRSSLAASDTVFKKNYPEMRYIPEGTFMVGTDERLPDEGPLHRVHLPAFYIDQYEATNEDYLAFVRATNRKPPIYWRDGVPPPSKERHPVVFVTWFDGNEFCHWRDKRLPTATEWEKAARGEDGRTYPWGDIFDTEFANTPYSKRNDTTPVGSFPKGRSPYGVDDMSGNAWEWTSSWYRPYPGNKTPRLDTYGQRYRVLKGGSFVNCSFYKCGISAPVFNRSFFIPATKNKGFGFRCAKSV